MTTTNNYKSFISLLEEIDKEERTQRDRGTLFELLVIPFFRKEPAYARLFDIVWTLSDVPDEYNIPKKDTGVDLVARERETGDLVAIQCKFYSKETKIYKDDIDSFLNEVGKSYYSKGIVIATTDKWSVNAEEALGNRDKDIQRIGLSHFYESQIDWSSYSFSNPTEVKLHAKKTPRPHQVPAIEAVVEAFKTVSRGKMIMAPGTGKTYTSMAIAEELAAKKDGIFRVLYLVPSIQLLSQTLLGWNADSNFQMDSIAVCSDRKVTKTQGNTKIEDIAAADIGYPATTNYEKLLEYQNKIESNDAPGDFLTVFSTYHSIDVIIEAQKNGFYEFDLVVCDEAHRTTGATEQGKEDSSFTKVHYDHNIKTEKRLYQTATPRVYGDAAVQKAVEMSVVIADMDNPELYGEELFRIGFGEAIRNGILTDYKVMVLAVDEEMVARRFQQMLANKDSELEFDDITKIIGCWNGLVRRKSDSDVALGAPMKRAISFTGTIRESKLITDMFSHVVDQYLNIDSEDDNQYSVEIDHADGSMNALEKNKKISWLKGDVPDNTCRILSNARFLTEGVDVPDLDAIMFLKPRKSKIDIAQAVGRVMRKVDGKDYGYVILPIGVPAGSDVNSLLDNNEKYRVVWEVLNALRSLDERFDASINKLELNNKKPDQIQIIGVGDAPEDGVLKQQVDQLSLMLTEGDLSDLERAIYGKIVRKVGNVRYWEDWSKDVAEIAQQHMMRIRVMLEDKDSKAYMEFMKFVKSLRHNINNSITEEQAIEMLAQHLITKPVFEALFDSYSFVNNNPVSKSIESILEVLDEQGLMKEQERLDSFYESVRIRAEGIDNLKAKQDIIIQLYEKFFKVAFKETTERLGIVFTPVEVVDFIIHSVDDVLKKHFGKSLASKGIHVLDPFTGTGTFVTRLLQSGLISKEDLLRKYTQEIHANEIVLLSYYIAAINIEETFHSIHGGEYIPFEGIVLTDTFESTEEKDSFISELFDENNERLKKQQQEPIFAIIGNPPYSVGQTNANDNNLNIKYPYLEKRIDQTYAINSSSSLKKSNYNSYMKAIRWATDRIADKGVIAFITANGYIDKTSSDGIRKTLYNEFNHSYIINLRGGTNGRLGEDAKKEGGNVFNIVTGVAICLLVKDSSDEHNINYYDIGEYLSAKDKLEMLKNNESVKHIEWRQITPDDNGDWINQRDVDYDKYPSVIEYFNDKVIGVSTNRDDWVYGFNKKNVIKYATTMIKNFNSEVEKLSKYTNDEKLAARNLNGSFIKWTRGLNNLLLKNQNIELESDNLILSSYRPFSKRWLFYNRNIIEMPGRFKEIMGENNRIIVITGVGARRPFSALVTDCIPNLHLQDSGQGFYEFNNATNVLFKENSNISEKIAGKLDLDLEDVFYYVYGVLNSNEYKEKYDNDLKKDLPRIPILKNKEEFVRVGRKLVELHLNYESVPLYDELEIKYKLSNPSYKVKKMKFPKKDLKETIIFNSDITITNIPKKAYEYIVNGRPAIEWIINQYQVKTDKNSGIVDDPNLYSEDEKYIFNLLLRIINLSVQTVDLVNSLPPIEIEE
ncbi:type ISP restriction/modification enzyme [Sporosarcina sp. BP05]|uniref:DEAD/DEAH box helicase n=1 Tax=Sporosarcina sp. BP05 TaxID=2758726 RepID=UPI0021053198|nr:type ISP restriction/modification enzyme [Sporosarcina sp. BP05]